MENSPLTVDVRPRGDASTLLLTLQRRYHHHGTNGKLLFQKRLLCHTIELPWQNMQPNKSCIPEGKYRLLRHRIARQYDQLHISGVPGRHGMLIHSAKDTLGEPYGSIVTVTKTIAPGMGIYSRIALERIKDLVYPVLKAGEEVWLEITRENQ